MCENELWCPECGLKAGKRVLQRYMQLRGYLTRLKSMVSLLTLSLAGDNNFSHCMYEKRFILRGFSKGFNKLRARTHVVLRVVLTSFFTFLSQTTPIFGVIR